MPLNHSTVTQGLKSPSLEVIRVQAKTIKHPILKPLDFDDRDGLSPDEAAILAVLANPKLRAIRDQRGIAAAQLLQVGILPNPQLSYSLDFPTAGSTQGTINAFVLGLGWDITSLITRGANIDAASAQAVSVELDIAWQEWQVAQGAKQHVYRLIFLQKQLDVAREEEKKLRENVDAVRKAVNYGDMTAVDLSAAESALKTVQLSVLTIEQQLKEERIALNQSLGFPPEDAVPIQQGIEPSFDQNIPSLTEVINGIENRRLDLLALKMGYQSQEARLRSAILAQFPRINIGFSQARDTTNVGTSGFGITIDLPFFDRNQGRIAIEKATRKQLFDEYIARLFEAQSNVSSVLADCESVKRQIDATEESVNTLNSLVQTYYKAFLEGNADVLTYYNARSDLISKQIDVFKLKQTLADLNIALELAAGQYLGNLQGKEKTNETLEPAHSYNSIDYGFDPGRWILAILPER
jgi:outer membrane protein TolC